MTQSRDSAMASTMTLTAIQPSRGMDANVSTIAAAALGRGSGSGAFEKKPIVAGRLVLRARPCDNCLRFDCRLLAVARVAARPHDVAVDLVNAVGEQNASQCCRATALAAGLAVPALAALAALAL